MRSVVHGLMEKLKQGTRGVQGQVPCSAGEGRRPLLGKLVGEELQEVVGISSIMVLAHSVIYFPDSLDGYVSRYVLGKRYLVPG